MSAVLVPTLTQVVVNLAALWAQKALDANMLLAKSQAEGREPTAEEVQALHDLDDAARDQLQANIDAHRDPMWGKPVIKP